MRFSYQNYVILIFSILTVYFILAGGNLSNMLTIIIGFWGVPDIIKYPIIVLFLILTWFAWNDYKGSG